LAPLPCKKLYLQASIAIAAASEATPLRLKAETLLARTLANPEESDSLT
jgi:hypothetical protein